MKIGNVKVRFEDEYYFMGDIDSMGGTVEDLIEGFRLEYGFTDITYEVEEDYMWFTCVTTVKGVRDYYESEYGERLGLMEYDEINKIILDLEIF